MLVRDARWTTLERTRREPAFANLLLDEAATLFLNGDPQTARLVLLLTSKILGAARILVGMAVDALLHRILRHARFASGSG